jgi:integrase
MRLRHVDAFYLFCDEHFGTDSFDSALSLHDAVKTQHMVEMFYAALTADPNYTTTAVQRWDTVRTFVQTMARRLAPQSDAWNSLSSLLCGMGAIRSPKRGRFKFIRALPSKTLADLFEVAEPGTVRNPFKGEAVQWRNWLIFNLLIMCGLRRGEAMLLEVDSLKRDVDPDTGELVQWLDVTSNFSQDPRATKPSMKTEQSHRQIPVSASLADLYEHYVSNIRVSSDEHPYLLTSRSGSPLSAESLTKTFEAFSRALSAHAKERFFEFSRGKKNVSPHDLRHTCATARYCMFMKQENKQELVLQRMRAFFGWSITSSMPEHYARAAIHDDLMRSWTDLFDKRMHILRSIHQ